MVLVVAKVIVISILVGIAVGIILLIYLIMKSYNNTVDRSYTKASDKEILLFINSTPDKVVNADDLTRKLNFTKNEARLRLGMLHNNGLLNILYNSMMTKASYTLAAPITKSYDLALSTEPFMTIEDLLLIFKHYEFKVSLTELCLVTGLPIKVIKREMKYFKNQKIVKVMLKMDNEYTYKQVYYLEEPYRSNPDAFLNINDANLSLKKIYEKQVRDDLV